ncbi:MAG: hypothetical protein ABJC19_06020 [Gemmatimonadota bacterium]
MRGAIGRADSSFLLEGFTMWGMLLALGSTMIPLALPAGPDPVAQVRVDASRREVVVTIGPFHVPNMPAGMDHAQMTMMNDHNTPVIHFAWPIQAWLRGFRIEATSADGKRLDSRMIHHLIGINFDRRQLVYPAFERIFGAGSETEAALVPKSIGVPMVAGSHLGVYLAWKNETGKELNGVTVTIYLPYSPPNMNPRPIDALPFYADVNLTVGGEDAFDVRPGHSEKAFEFTVPVGGRLLAFGGHMHDYGTSVRLEDVAAGKVIAKVTATRTAAGLVTSVSRSLPGAAGNGIQLKSGVRYRVVGVYDNPTGKLLVDGGMAHMVGLFAPDDMARWPALDRADKGTIADLADLTRMGKGASMHEGMGH